MMKLPSGAKSCAAEPVENQKKSFFYQIFQESKESVLTLKCSVSSQLHVLVFVI